MYGVNVLHLKLKEEEASSSSVPGMVGSCGVVRRERRRPAYPFVITIREIPRFKQIFYIYSEFQLYNKNTCFVFCFLRMGLLKHRCNPILVLCMKRILFFTKRLIET